MIEVYIYPYLGSFHRRWVRGRRIQLLTGLETPGRSWGWENQPLVRFSLLPPLVTAEAHLRNEICQKLGRWPLVSFLLHAQLNPDFCWRLCSSLPVFMNLQSKLSSLIGRIPNVRRLIKEKLLFHVLEICGVEERKKPSPPPVFECFWSYYPTSGQQSRLLIFSI